MSCPPPWFAAEAHNSFPFTSLPGCPSLKGWFSVSGAMMSGDADSSAFSLSSGERVRLG